MACENCEDFKYVALRDEVSTLLRNLLFAIKPPTLPENDIERVKLFFEDLGRAVDSPHGWDVGRAVAAIPDLSERQALEYEEDVEGLLKCLEDAWALIMKFKENEGNGPFVFDDATGLLEDAKECIAELNTATYDSPITSMDL